MSAINQAIRYHEVLNRFMDLYVGDLESLERMDLDDFEAMVDKLEELRAQGKLNLETDFGIQNLRSVVDTYMEEDEE